MTFMNVPDKYISYLKEYPLLATIGNTPIVRLDLPNIDTNISIHAKLEYLNPGGSIKDRPILFMLLDAIISGDLSSDKTILDATSGNAGISYAMIGAALGYKVELVMPANASEERKKRVIAHGADPIYTDAMLGYDETLREVERLFNTNSEKYFWCDQYGNSNNPKAHYMTTGVEILHQLPDITHFVGGVGTGGTISGVGKRLKEYNPNIQIVCIDFSEWPGVEGLKPLNEGHIIPDTFDSSVVDEMITIDVDEAHRLGHLLAKKGYFVGQSSSAYLSGVYKVADKIKKGTIGTIFNDFGERYFSTSAWD